MAQTRGPNLVETNKQQTKLAVFTLVAPLAPEKNLQSSHQTFHPTHSATPACHSTAHPPTTLWHTSSPGRRLPIALQVLQVLQALRHKRTHARRLL